MAVRIQTCALCSGERCVLVVADRCVDALQDNSVESDAFLTTYVTGCLLGRRTRELVSVHKGCQDRRFQSRSLV